MDRFHPRIDLRLMHSESDKEAQKRLIKELNSFVKWAGVILGGLLSIGSALVSAILGNFNFTYSFLLIPIGFTLAVFMGMLWNKFVLGPIQFRLLKKRNRALKQES